MSRLTLHLSRLNASSSRWHAGAIRSRLGVPRAKGGRPDADGKESFLSRRRFARILLVAIALLTAGLLASPRIIQAYWGRRASNPVRRGVARARQLGCFSCHGNLGSTGIKDPGGENLEVPAWSGGMSMMYVESDADIHRFILEGSIPKVESGETAAAPGGEPPKAAVAMPSFKSELSGSDLEDLTAAFKVLSGMVAPPSDTPGGRGLDRARTWGCFACHGPAGSGGLPNPGSFTGFIPGWHGADFQDMVRDRTEFDTWITKGSIPRLAANPVATHFMSRQRIKMPAYRNFAKADLDDLWAYSRWLDRTGGGIRKEAGPHP